ncbi:hypothetical protein V3C99_001445, partial [Haemonchus contortus]
GSCPSIGFVRLVPWTVVECRRPSTALDAVYGTR